MASNIRVLVTLITFFGLTFGLFAYAGTQSPSMFTNTAMSGAGASGNLANPIDLLAINDSNAVVITTTNGVQDFDVKGWSWTEWEYVTSSDSNADPQGYIIAETYEDYQVLGVHIINLNYHDFRWSFPNGTYCDVRVNLTGFGSPHWVMPVAYIEEIFLGQNLSLPRPSGGDAGFSSVQNLKFVLTTDLGSMNVQIDFDHTLYIDPWPAIKGTAPTSGLYFSIIQDFSDRRTSMNILNFIGGLFAFSPPGVPAPVSILISGLWYGCIAALTYVIFSVVLSVIPLTHEPG